MSCIQVTEETANVLTSFGFECQYRGKTNVKGKGLLPTFFVMINDVLEFTKGSDHKSNATSFETQL